jgi:LDH2 family malate/lactate/ureidoglycolate dehydrogenase
MGGVGRREKEEGARESLPERVAVDAAGDATTRSSP